ncbi:uncharacterized protein TNCV_4342551 [Trichonephila clavipes]|nr:uncharacterized protein TNCV_4342551 [Trichonephila clavipes]
MYLVVNNNENPIATGYAYKYTKDASGKSIYPLDTNGNQIALPKLEEIVFGDYIHNNDGAIKFPLNQEGDPKYETDINTNDQVYFIKTDGSINWGVDKNGNQRYAKRKNGDEYYPDTREFARHDSGSPQYAHTRDGKVIFPLDVELNESYIKDDTNGDSHTTRRYKEVILNGKYAKTNLQEAKYPLDEYGNEYTLEIPIQIAGKEKDYFPRGYPITNDNWVIVPEVDGKEFISDQLLPEVQINNIIGKL